ncbi:MAG: hypothetical protein IJ060_09925 [Oscillospiraceae bacterium]|nr:hypothetical protein [Oscillospiraceae bacterium]
MLQAAMCPNCGAQLKVDASHKEAWCHACDSTILVTDAITNYNTIYHVQAENVYGAKASMKELLQKEKVFLQINDFAKLRNLYNEMVESYPQRHEGWWGLIYCETSGFRIQQSLENLEKWFGLVKQFAPQNVYGVLEKQFCAYEAGVLEEQIRTLDNSLQYAKSSLERDRSYYENNRRKVLRQSRRRDKRRLFAKLFWLIVGLISLLVTIMLFANSMILVGIGGVIITWIIFLYGVFTNENRIGTLLRSIRDSNEQLSLPFDSRKYDQEIRGLEREISVKQQKLRQVRALC